MLQTKKQLKTRYDLVGKDDPLGIIQNIVFWPIYQIVYAQS